MPADKPSLQIAVQAIPAVLTKAELEVHLHIAEDFLRTWMEAATDDIPAIPFFTIGQKTLFPSAAVLAWLAEYHGYGGDMRDPSTRPKTRRKQPAA